MGIDPITLTFAAIAAVGTGASIYEGQQAAKATNNASRIEQQQNDLQAARQKRDAIRQARIANANATAASEKQGVGTASSAVGGQGSIASQLGDTLSFLDQYNYFSDQASAQLGKARSYAASADAWGQISGAAEKAAPYGPQIGKAAQKVFSGG